MCVIRVNSKLTVTTDLTIVLANHLIKILHSVIPNQCVKVNHLSSRFWHLL